MSLQDVCRIMLVFLSLSLKVICRFTVFIVTMHGRAVIGLHSDHVIIAVT